MKISLIEELAETLHSIWSSVHVSTAVSLHQVIAVLATQLPQYSGDRTGQVDWASLALGSAIITTTTHPDQARVSLCSSLPHQHSSCSSRLCLLSAGPSQGR